MIEKILNLFPSKFSHQLALYGLKYFSFLLETQTYKQNPFTYKGCTFENRLGLAAGFDKNAFCLNGLSKLGFGHIEVGSITYVKNVEHKDSFIRKINNSSMINYLGLPNEGFEKINSRLKNYQGNKKIGANIAPIFFDSLSEMIQNVKADYVTLNLSCPNLDISTQNLKSVLHLCRRESPNKIILIKISPDSNDFSLIETCLDVEMDGFVITNSSKNHNYEDRGGLTGSELRKRSNEVLKEVRRISPQAFIIGLGGVNSYDSYKEKLDLGADLVQIYTGFIYKGVSLIKEILGENFHDRSNRALGQDNKNGRWLF